MTKLNNYCLLIPNILVRFMLLRRIFTCTRYSITRVPFFAAASKTTNGVVTQRINVTITTAAGALIDVWNTTLKLNLFSFSSSWFHFAYSYSNFNTDHFDIYLIISLVFATVIWWRNCEIIQHKIVFNTRCNIIRVDIIRVYSPVHVIPLPEYPALQLQEKLPTELIQTALSAQLWLLLVHSLMSEIMLLSNVG